MSELKALIFDVDGTLTDNEQKGHRVAFNRAFEQAGLDWHWDPELYEELLEVFGGKERMRYFIEDFLPAEEAPDDVDRLIRKVHAEKTRQYGKLLRAGALPLRTGVERLIREAHEAGIRLAIASTTTLENATTLVSKSLGDEALDWFDVFACGDVVENKKPAPDIYQYTLDQLALSATSCLVLEDSESGLVSARDAGLHSIITVNDSTREQNFEGALLVLENLGEPDKPMQVLAGNPGSSTFVDLDLLRRLLREA
jgi:HAD superfamily hydrolase (TIGR01509 family)